MQSIPYVLVGGDIGRWTMKLGNDSNTTNRGIAGNSHTNYNKTQVRPKIGAGVQIPLCDSLSARLEYAYLFGPTIKKTLTDSITGINWNHKTKINQQSVNVVVIYNF